MACYDFGNDNTVIGDEGRYGTMAAAITIRLSAMRRPIITAIPAKQQRWATARSYNSETSGYGDVAIGSAAGSSMTTGINNVVIGTSVGSTTLTIGSNNILIGTTSAVDATTSSQSNYINIGGTYQGYDTTHTALIGGGSLATTATGGFVEISSSAGVPTGAPTAHTGFVPLEIDTTDNRLYFYNSGWQNVERSAPRSRSRGW